MSKLVESTNVKVDKSLENLTRCTESEYQKDNNEQRQLKKVLNTYLNTSDNAEDEAYTSGEDEQENKSATRQKNPRYV